MGRQGSQFWMVLVLQCIVEKRTSGGPSGLVIICNFTGRGAKQHPGQSRGTVKCTYKNLPSVLNNLCNLPLE